MVNRWGHPTLYALTSELIWPQAIQRAQSHPHEINWQDVRGATALHHSCRFQYTLEVVREMVKMGQSAACIQDKRGYTPLHVACWSGASEAIIRLLLDAHRDATSLADKHGRTPLHLACSSVSLASTTAMEMLIQANPGVSMCADKAGKTPLGLLCDRNQGRLKLAMKCIDEGEHDTELIYDNFLRPFWRQLRLLLNVNAAELFTDEQNWRLVHALATIPNCPPILFELALKLHPEQIREKVAGSLPIHLAAECPTTAVHEIYKDGFYVCSLLSLFPSACQIRDGLGRLPLHIAIKSKKSWHSVLQKLFKAFPQAIALRDGQHLLLPVHLSALPSDANEIVVAPEQQLTSMLEILRLNPSTVRMY